MDLYIVTGGSKGLGLQVCLKALEEGHQVLCLSRSKPSIKHPYFKYCGVDLSTGIKGLKKIEKAFDAFSLDDLKKIHLINNAGLVEPIGAVGSLNPIQLELHYQTNLVAPVLLANFCIQYFSKAKKQINIFNIGSGAGYRSIPGWSAYCSSKAGLKMFTEVLFDDLKLAKNKKIETYYFSPGVVDTDMQATIRRSSKKDLPSVGDFKKYKKSKKLRSPVDVAVRVFEFCNQKKKLQRSSPLLTIDQLENMKV